MARPVLPLSAFQSPPPDEGARRFGWLPKPGSWKFHLLLSAVAIFVLGPLGGVAASYMNFSLGFFLGGQVLAGILGSAVTYGYGPEGKHAANYMQTMAASVASMCAMSVIIQALVWLGMPQPPAWHLMLFMGCVGMYGVGLGMLYTPLLVDRLQLDYPSGYAVANILRALTDRRLLRISIAKLGGGTGAGALAAALTEHVAALGSIGLSVSTVGAGMVVGSRITVPAILGGVVGWAFTPMLRSWGWLKPEEPFRKVGFLIGLAMICGAAAVDLSLLAVQAVGRIRNRARPEPHETSAWKKVNLPRLLAWVGFWGVAVVVVATRLLGQPAGYILFGMALALLFVLINGISYGITDQNPISSAFVISVLLMSLLGLREPMVGMMAASILFICTSVGCDMQQDRSTGWRLGTDRTVQFRYQVIGIVMGSVLSVGLARLFMTAFPVLGINQLDNPQAHVGQWNSAMTYKFVGAIRGLGVISESTAQALLFGLVLGFSIEVARKLIKRSARYQGFVKSSPTGFAVGWALDALLLPSPYASSFGGFVNLSSSLWFGLGGILASLWNTFMKRAPPQVAGTPGEGEALPEDMSTMSLVGGGLIAGESLYFLCVGLLGLVSLLG